MVATAAAAAVAVVSSCLSAPPLPRASTFFPSPHCHPVHCKLTCYNFICCSTSVGGWHWSKLRESYMSGGMEEASCTSSRNHQLRKKFVAEGGAGARRLLYGEAETYVLIEPGEDEQFVTLEELQEKLKTWLEQWPGKELPPDLVQYDSIEDAVEYLVTSVCELELGGGQGSIQWFEVRLDQVRHMSILPPL
ncbi:unnamed protein product [Sphagnum troendelagicum]|uniref:Chlororespiratory reduction 7 n=1 Tax=Sphagnum troendelagicum TaxID=128251 RepID=A0ABP0USW8_9BRYO